MRAALKSKGCLAAALELTARCQRVDTSLPYGNVGPWIWRGFGGCYRSGLSASRPVSTSCGQANELVRPVTRPLLCTPVDRDAFRSICVLSPPGRSGLYFFAPKRAL